jgi:iron complex outermembrane receptor protein
MRDELEAGLSTFRYAEQSNVATNELPTDGYTMVDADVSYRLPLTLGNSSVFGFLKGTNLLDEDARRSTSPLKDYAPLPARSLTAGLRMSF